MLNAEQLAQCQHCGWATEASPCPNCERGRDAIPLCKNCTHFRAGPEGWNLDTCAYPHPVRVDPVQGKAIERFCTTERMSTSPCGPSGYLYERRNPF